LISLIIRKNRMYAGYIILAVIALGSIGGGLYLFGEAKNTHDRRKAIERMYDDEHRHHTTLQRPPPSAPRKRGE
jgi:hypothetical protein